MKRKFPGFKNCMAMMRNRDPQTCEDGFYWLLPHAGEHLPELIEEFGKEKNPGLRCWLMDLIGSAKAPETFDFLAAQLRDADRQIRYGAIRVFKRQGTREARMLLYQARSYTFATPEETAEFLAELRP